MSTNTSLDCSAERFIPLRGASYGSFRVSHKHPRPTAVSVSDYCRKFNGKATEVNYMQYYHKKNQYKDLLANTLFQSPRRVLYFSPEQKARREETKSSEEYEWPVRARTKPLIRTPVYVTDLPFFDTESVGQKIDWGPNGFLSVIHENCCIHLHNPDTNRAQRLILKGIGNCLKWTFNENHMVISREHGGVVIYDVNQKKIAIKSVCPPSIYRERVTFIAVSPSYIIICHEKGKIESRSKELLFICSLARAHKSKIISGKVSWDEKYLATTGLDSYVKIWSLPSLENIFAILCTVHPITSIDWHPWKSSLLAVGKSLKNSLCTLWDINKPSDMCKPGHPYEAKIDCLTFNPNSAELVVGFWLDRPNTVTERCHNIVVQNNCNTVVDDINFHYGRAVNLMWDKDGQRLATYGADQNLAIWNFFGKEESKKKNAPTKKQMGIFNEYSIR